MEPLNELIFKPLSLTLELIKEFLMVLYVGVGLIFLVFLISKEFPTFLDFLENILRYLKLVK